MGSVDPASIAAHSASVRCSDSSCGGASRSDEVADDSHGTVELPSTRVLDGGQGDDVKDKYIIGGLAAAAFLLTLGVLSWLNGWWSSGEPSAQADAAAN